MNRLNKIVTWFIEPFQIFWSEFQYLRNSKKDRKRPDKEKGRISELQVFNFLLLIIYSIFFVSFYVYVIMLFIIGLDAVLGVLVGLLMMALIKWVQKNKYYKKRDAFIKNDGSFIES